MPLAVAEVGFGQNACQVIKCIWKNAQNDVNGLAGGLERNPCTTPEEEATYWRVISIYPQSSSSNPFLRPGQLCRFRYLRDNNFRGSAHAH